MKRTIRTLALVLSLAVSFTACKKDKDEATNYFTHAGGKHETNYAVSFASQSYSEFVFANVDPSTDPTTGTASAASIMFDFAEITPGTYTFKDDSDADYDKTKNFFDAYAFVNMDLASEEAEFYSEDITAGTATITKDGSSYKVVYDLDFNGVKIAGQYSGAIKIVN